MQYIKYLIFTQLRTYTYESKSQRPRNVNEAEFDDYDNKNRQKDRQKLIPNLHYCIN